MDGYPGDLALRNSVHTEHRFLGFDEGDRDVSKINLDTGRLVETGRISGRSVPRSSSNSEDRFLSSDKDGRRMPLEPTNVFRVNMIRVHGRQEEERNKPKFGSGWAAPPQGADSGRPSESVEARSMGQERRMGPGGVQHKDDHGSSMFMQKQKSQEVPYSMTSSEERYDRIEKSRDARPKSSTLVPEVWFKSCYSDTSGPGYSSGDDSSVRWTDRIYPGVNPVDQDPWNKVMYSVLEPPDQRGPALDHVEGDTANQRYQEVLEEGFCRSGERLRNDGTPMRAKQGFGRSRRPLSKVEFHEDLGGLPIQQHRLYEGGNEARDQPSRAYSSLTLESLLERVAARGRIEDRRRPAAKRRAENDERFPGALGQVPGQPRLDTQACPAGDRLEKVVDVMMRSLANLNERMAAVELNGGRTRRTQSSRIATVQSDAGEPGWGSAFSEGSYRPEAPRRRTVGMTPMPEEADRRRRTTVRLGRRPARADEHTSGREDDADRTGRRRLQRHHHAKFRTETETKEESHARRRSMRRPGKDSSRRQPRTGEIEKSHFTGRWNWTNMMAPQI